MNFFEEAVAIERAHAAEYICPICQAPKFICVCPSFVEQVLRDDEIAELNGERGRP